MAELLHTVSLPAWVIYGEMSLDAIEEDTNATPKLLLMYAYAMLTAVVLASPIGFR